MNHKQLNKVTLAGLFVSLGIIFGDIGTSPLYVMKAIVGHRVISEELILGGLSCIFWTLTFQTTLKYVIITLRADNNGEGGIFSLYTLVRKRGTWLIFPAMVGGATLLADGVITPAISISSAIEGLRALNPAIKTIPIVMAILTLIFFIQQFGTKSIGRAFGPVMFVWFSTLAVLGLAQLIDSPGVLKALNPMYAYNLLANYPHGFLLLGAVFLCTTGAEALYSDLGHCGRGNIRVSWIFVKIALLLNYAGQCAWLLKTPGQHLTENPFYGIMPEWFLVPGIILATLAAIIASQALISGSFTLISEAIQLNIWPKSKIVYPTEQKGQLFVPGFNTMLWLGTLAVVWYFEESEHMEAAYGLAITITMLATTVLLASYLRHTGAHKIVVGLLTSLFLIIELAFFAANLEKFPHGGFVSILMAGALFYIMWVWRTSGRIRGRYQTYTSLLDNRDTLIALSEDKEVPKYATHLVYLTKTDNEVDIESRVLYSILRKQPKRADVYWFIHLEVLDTPYTMEYKVLEVVPGKVFHINFYLGFRVQPRINLFFRKVVEEMVEKGEVNIMSRYESLEKNNQAGDFRFVVQETFLSYDNELPFGEKMILGSYFGLKHFALSDERSFGLDTSSVVVEKVPMVVRPVQGIKLVRLPDDAPEPVEAEVKL